MNNATTQDFSKDVLNHMLDRLADYQEMYGDLYNLVQHRRNQLLIALPSTTLKDIRHYYHKDTPYYTNSSHLPVSFTEDIFASRYSG